MKSPYQQAQALTPANIIIFDDVNSGGERESIISWLKTHPTLPGDYAKTLQGGLAEDCEFQISLNGPQSDKKRRRSEEPGLKERKRVRLIEIPINTITKPPLMTKRAHSSSTNSEDNESAIILSILLTTAMTSESAPDKTLAKSTQGSEDNEATPRSKPRRPFSL